MELPTITAEKGKIDSKGNCQILIRVSWKRSHIRTTTGIKVPHELFTPGALINEKFQNALYKNGLIREQIQKLDVQILEAARKAPLNKEILASIVSGGKIKGIRVLDLYEVLKEKYAGIMSPKTLRQWGSSIHKMDDYAPGITATQIDQGVMMRFEQHLRNKLNNKNNTVWSNMKTLRSMFSKSVTLGLIETNPFEQYRGPSYKQTQRNYLMPKEATKIEKMADSAKANKTHRLIAAWWALAYHSGLRDGDLAKWDEEKMVRDGKLYFTDEKTQTPHYIPLYPALQKAIERIRKYRSKPENTVCNRFLVEIGNSLDMPFKVTMHTARHSFAVGYLERGGKLEELQRLLGHKSIRTTAIYGKISDSRLDAEVKRVFGKKK